MSEWGSIVDALETHVRAVVTLPTGANGWERGVRAGQSLATGQLPHVFAHDPTETATELDHQQELVEMSWQLDLWTSDATQEAVALKLDAIVTRLRTDPTLGGLVDYSLVSGRGVVEAAIAEKSERRAGVLIVTTRKVV